ncbi:ATP phosphoribosyltransferase regulatory subunit [Marivita sp. XM-24bin2]|jgi:ATP phosphoribosyltransferase regulatory subunit|uniref:ATP phosphoribosyltransferase regulatory subunit n=1 Tax=unclassified Marivita TaxID=2632480 RepID=UPI000D7A9019|nr:ATP phosphoribosyltransferase regulatory subunit [Marivita sp. XM-24bin2]MCR9110634.1 ATP phosphoribosyltransferase regulatory subunit [Paracoccaceae bacterium]PWL33913.1 MAG: ATP phosphoribosyltransferase regulatory subunit [Marivita sp. XM-24bin2]
MAQDIPYKSRVRIEAEAICDGFVAAGAARFETDILLSAEVLLDLYGEDIRARAYVTTDPERGEMMLRPDFTVPVVQYHMEGDGFPASYTYFGEVFRKQEDHPDRRSEYMQVGYEEFGGANAAVSDAGMFGRFSEVLAPLSLRAATGDIGILIAMVRGLATTEDRRVALMRHIWRPARFTALVKRFAGLAPVPPSRAALLAAEAPLQDAGVMIGLRSEREIETRIDALRADASEPAMSSEMVNLITAVLSVSETCPNALEQLRDIAVDMPGLLPALDRFEARCDAMARCGVDVENLPFEASYGRTSMEYYDGFVFGFYSEARPDLPPVATGGRYDALTRRLGQGREIPAVGGVIRPDLVLDLGGLP